MLKRKMIVAVLEIIELDVGPVAALGGSNKYLDLSPLGGANEKKMAVNIQHRDWRPIPPPIPSLTLPNYALTLRLS